jgi:glutathione S-transferase
MAEYVLHCFAQSGNARKPAPMLELAGADRTSCCIDFSRYGDMFRDDELGIHWRDSHPAVAA